MPTQIDLWRLPIDTNITRSIFWCNDVFEENTWKLVDLRYLEFDNQQDAALYLLKWGG